MTHHRVCNVPKLSSDQAKCTIVTPRINSCTWLSCFNLSLLSRCFKTVQALSIVKSAWLCTNTSEPFSLRQSFVGGQGNSESRVWVFLAFSKSLLPLHWFNLDKDKCSRLDFTLHGSEALQLLWCDIVGTVSSPTSLGIELAPMESGGTNQLARLVIRIDKMGDKMMGVKYKLLSILATTGKIFNIEKARWELPAGFSLTTELVDWRKNKKVCVCVHIYMYICLIKMS